MENYLRTATILANILDNQFSFFGIRLGFNAILDLIPELGDVIATILSLYIVWLAVKMKVPPTKLIHMLFNIFVNLVIGLIPFLGSVAFIINKANLKNLEILKNHARNNSGLAYSTVAV